MKLEINVSVSHSALSQDDVHKTEVSLIVCFQSVILKV